LNTKKWINDEWEIVVWDPWQNEIIEILWQSYEQLLLEDCIACKLI
jgi:hypothetical protein